MKVGDGSTAWVSLPYLPAGAATTLSPGRNIDGQLFDGSANITVIAPGTHAATSKATPVDADELPLVDSAASNVLKKLTWANIKATLFGTPAVVLGTVAAAGTAATSVRTDATIVAFDATVPSTQAFGDAAAVGTAVVAARRDHKHAMPATPTSVSGNAGTATALQNARTINGVSFDGTANITNLAEATHATTSKVTPADNDELPLADSAASNVLKKLLWSNVKATLKTYFDTLYPSGSGTSTGTNTGDVAFATNAVVLGTAAAAGAASTVMRSNDTIAAFDTTAPVTQAFSDAAAVGTAAFAARRDHKHGMPASPAAPAGSTALVYRYTVVTSDKASIDTGVDTADAGSNDWTNGDLLEVWLLLRTDDAGAAVNIDVTVNNDGSSIYDLQNVQGSNVTAAASGVRAAAKWVIATHGSGGSASYPTASQITFPGYAGTTFNKVGVLVGYSPDATAGNNFAETRGLGYRSTNAITRLKVAAQGAAKLKVGSELLIYKRLAS